MRRDEAYEEREKNRENRRRRREWRSVQRRKERKKEQRRVYGSVREKEERAQSEIEKEEKRGSEMVGRHEGSGRGLDVIVTRGMCPVRVSVSARGSGVGCLSLIHIHQTLINHRPGTPTASYPLGSRGKRSWRTKRKKRTEKRMQQIRDTDT